MCVKNKFNNLLYSNKSTNFNKKILYVSYNMYNFTVRYNSYDTYIVSYDSWAFIICRYDIKLFTHDMIRIAYCTILTTIILTTMVEAFWLESQLCYLWKLLAWLVIGIILLLPKLTIDITFIIHLNLPLVHVLNTCFQFLNNITHIFICFFMHVFSKNTNNITRTTL